MNFSTFIKDPSHQPILIAIFVLLISFILFIDLLVVRRKTEQSSFKSAAISSLFYVGLAALFGMGLWFQLGHEAAKMYFASYLIEMSLSVDNLFVFLLVFKSFQIKEQNQHRILFWGILGALVMRGLCIGIGVAALEKFHALNYIFAAILVWSGIKTFIGTKDDPTDPANGIIAKSIRRFIPVTSNYHGTRFFIRENHVLHATPMFLSLILIEISDVIFAVDSIPAALAVSNDPFIVYSSNIFAILGLRSFYFILSRLVNLFSHLDKAISFVLVFIGIKMATSTIAPISTNMTLAVIFISLISGIGASFVFKENDLEKK